MSEDKLRRDISRGEKMARLLEDELMQEAFAAVERDYVDWWQNHTTADDAGGREIIWLQLRNLKKLKAHLLSVVANGRIAESELRQLQRKGA